MNADFVFIHREAIPVGPPVLEWVLSRVMKKKIIYDFDDAIWTTDIKNENALASWFRWRRKVASICKWSFKISCGNDYLSSFAKRYNDQVVTMPTTIDTENLHNPVLYKVNKDRERLVIAWTGSHSTLKYLSSLKGALKRIQERFPHTDLLVIADVPPDFELPRLTFRRWSKETEVSDLMLADIGVMPLPEDEWSLGKCGFKALQYMALEIATIASPVGVNTEIIQQRENGLLCRSDEEWYSAIELLVCNEELRTKIGRSGRETVVRRYSVSANTGTFLRLFEKEYNHPRPIMK